MRKACAILLRGIAAGVEWRREQEISIQSDRCDIRVLPQQRSVVVLQIVAGVIGANKPAYAAGLSL